jgi:F0F1-type ATP synthase assembly protein I
VSRPRQDSLAFYLSGLIIGISMTTLIYLLDMAMWTVPLLMFIVTAVGFVIVDAVRRRSVARSYMFSSTGSYTLQRNDGPRHR